MRNHLIQEITNEAQTNPNIVLVTGDLGFNVLNKFSDLFPERFINAGIEEQNMTSVAAGLALSGKCVFIYSIGNFSTLRCIEQIRNDICYHNANVKIVALGAGFAYGNLGMSHHATEDIACMRSLPNLTVFSPCDPLETVAVTKAAIALNGPCYIRLGRGGEPNLWSSFEELTVGKAYPYKHGEEGVIFATGSIIQEAKAALEELQKRGHDIGLYSFPTIKPIDRQTVIDCALKFPYIISLEEHNVVGGFGSAISEVLSSIPEKHAVLKRIGLQDVYTCQIGDTEYLRHFYHLDKDAVIQAVEGFKRDI
jgi:transketolase